MKALFLCCFVFAFFAFHADAQINLVPNPSFEDTVHCPDGGDELNNCGWVNPTATSPDYFNSCADITSSVKVPQNGFGYQFARTGNAYAGVYVATQMVINGPLVGREYIQHVLSDTLSAGKNYSVDFYVSRADYSTVAITQIGAFLSDTAISSNAVTNLPFVPQIISPAGFYITDTLNWTKISGTFTAQGGERYITIGNFKDAATTDTMNMPVTEIMGHFSYYYIDDVNVSLQDTSGTGIDEHTNDFFFNLFPNPSSGSIQLNYKLKANEKGKMLVYDLTGKKVREYELPGNVSDLYINDPLESGVYLYQVKVNDRVVKSDKLMIIQ